MLYCSLVLFMQANGSSCILRERKREIVSKKRAADGKQLGERGKTPTLDKAG